MGKIAFHYLSYYATQDNSPATIAGTESPARRRSISDHNSVNSAQFQPILSDTIAFVRLRCVRERTRGDKAATHLDKLNRAKHHKKSVTRAPGSLKLQDL